MKTKKIANLLKLGILLFGISLLLWNCEKEKDFPIYQTSTVDVVSNIQKVFKEEFNAKAYPFLKEPLWDKITESIFNAEEYFEIPFENLEGIDFQKSTMITTHKLVVKKAEDKLKLFIVFFAMPNEDGTIIDHISLDNLALKNAYISFFDLNRNNLASHRIKKGNIYKGDFKIKPIGGNNKQFARFPEENEDCQEVTIDRYERTCWGREIGLEFCTGWSYQFSYTMSSCDNPTGGPSYVNLEPECPEPGYKKDENGNCVANIEIYNQLSGKDTCIFNKIKELSLFKTTIGKFAKGSYNLTFKYGSECNNQPGEEACTDASDLENGNITVKILSSGRQSLDFAATLLHEGVHAEIYKYVEEHKSGVDPNDRKNLLYYYNHYKAENDNTYRTSIAQHQHMQDKFIIPIAKALRELDNKNYDLDYYKGFAWEGLKKYDYDKYLDENNVIRTMTPELYSSYINKMNTVLDNSNFKNLCN